MFHPESKANVNNCPEANTEHRDIKRINKIVSVLFIYRRLIPDILSVNLVDNSS